MRRLRRELLDSVQKMEERARCSSCAIPREVRQITTFLSKYCRKRAKRVDKFDKKLRTTFAIAFFHWVASGFFGYNLIIKHTNKLLDCQQWVDVAIQTMAIL